MADRTSAIAAAVWIVGAVLLSAILLVGGYRVVQTQRHSQVKSLLEAGQLDETEHEAETPHNLNDGAAI